MGCNENPRWKREQSETPWLKLTQREEPNGHVRGKLIESRINGNSQEGIILSTRWRAARDRVEKIFFRLFVAGTENFLERSASFQVRLKQQSGKNWGSNIIGWLCRWPQIPDEAFNERQKRRRQRFVQQQPTSKTSQTANGSRTCDWFIDRLPERKKQKCSKNFRSNRTSRIAKHKTMKAKIFLLALN